MSWLCGLGTDCCGGWNDVSKSSSEDACVTIECQQPSRFRRQRTRVLPHQSINTCVVLRRRSAARRERCTPSQWIVKRVCTRGHVQCCARCVDAEPVRPSLATCHGQSCPRACHYRNVCHTLHNKVLLCCHDAFVCIGSLTNGWLATASCCGPVQKHARNPVSRVHSCMTVSLRLCMIDGSRWTCWPKTTTRWLPPTRLFSRP